MELTFFTELGESYAVEIDENMELENVMALLEAEVSPIRLRSTPWIASVHVIILVSCEMRLILLSHFPTETHVIGRSPESQWPNKVYRMKGEISPIQKLP